MELSPAIERQRVPLLSIVAALFAMIGLQEGGVVERLSSPMYRAVLRVLRPAESAVRRIIIVAARSLLVKAPVVRSYVRTRAAVARKHHCRIVFKLSDPPLRCCSAFAHERRRLHIRMVWRPEPRLRVLDVGFDPRVPLFRQAAIMVQEAPPPEAGHSVSALRLSRRLAAIKSALEDLPHQARRYLRWQARLVEQHSEKRHTSLCLGRPPSFRKKATHEVDEILMECDWLVRDARQVDTS